MSAGKGSEKHAFIVIERDCRDFYQSHPGLIFPDSPYHWQEVCHIDEVLV